MKEIIFEPHKLITEEEISNILSVLDNYKQVKLKTYTLKSNPLGLLESMSKFYNLDYNSSNIHYFEKNPINSKIDMDVEYIAPLNLYNTLKNIVCINNISADFFDKEKTKYNLIIEPITSENFNNGFITYLNSINNKLQLEKPNPNNQNKKFWNKIKTFNTNLELLVESENMKLNN